jgi:type I restriction-modification system DNA methylase subunit
MGGKDGMRDPRFKVMHRGEELSLVTRSSDGQMLFLANMASKMNAISALGSRIAEVHNGSSLFTGDAGQGESNIRRWLIENDWLEAIVALPLNLFYNTGIATYIWVLSNKKLAHRKGKVQLIDASQWFKPLRKNLGKKNCELSPEDIEHISRTFLAFKESPESKIFPNAAFGYWKVTWRNKPMQDHIVIFSLGLALQKRVRTFLPLPIWIDVTVRFRKSWRSTQAATTATTTAAATTAIGADFKARQTQSMSALVQ